MIARVQSRGQVTVPQEIREACGIDPGTDLLFRPIGPGTFECRALPPQRSLLEAVEHYSMPGHAPDLNQLREEMGDELAREYARESAPAR